MKIAAVADVHAHNHAWEGGQAVAGINKRCALVLGTLRKAVHQANKATCDHFVVCGDLLDSDDASPQIEAAVIDELRRFNGSVHLLLGNHEQTSTLRGDHALGPMASHATRSGFIYVYDKPEALDAGVVMLPFRPEPVEAWLEQELAGYTAMMAEPVIVFAHFGIADANTPSYLSGAHDQIAAATAHRVMRKVGARLLIVGNWHNAGTWISGKRRIEQVGALCPTGFNNPGAHGYGGLVIVDTATLVVERKTIPGPRFLKLVWDPEETSTLLSEIVSVPQAYVNLAASPSAISEARAWLKDVAAEHDSLLAFKVTPIREEVVEQAARAAKSSAKAENRESAIAAFVKSMPLDAAVSRKAVLRRVMGYVKGAAE